MTITHFTHDAPTQAAALPSAIANMNSNVLDEAILKKLIDPDVYHAFAAVSGDRAADGPRARGRAGTIDTGVGPVERLHRLFALVLADTRADSW